MGTELDAFPFQELNQQTPSRARTLEIISSWLDIDDVYAPTSPHHQPQEFQDHREFHHPPDDHFFNFDSSEFDVDPLSLLARPDSPFLHGLYDATGADPHPHRPPVATTHNDDYYHPVLPHQQDECDTFLIDSNEFDLITPSESQDGGSDHFYDDPSGKMASESSNVDTPEPMSVDQNNEQTEQQGEGDVPEDNEEEDEVVDDDPKPGAVHCKNLLSERNRRKRLSQQLLALRALVPNITKMDKRSVLVDALNYLRNIHEETARLQKELKQQQQQQQHQPRLNTIRESCQDNPVGTLRVPRTTAPPSASKPKAQIAEIDTERIEDRRFVVKITCKGSDGVGGDILRVIESMGFEITNATVQQMSPQEILATIFVKVRKPGKMTEEKLKDCITSMALRSGLTLQNP